MKKTLVPKLRFPEFRDAGEWKIEPLGKVGENLDSKRVPITEKDRVKGDIPYYGASGIIDYVKDFIFNEDLLCISEDGANLVARTYPIAFTISGKTWVNNHAHVLKFKNSFTQLIIENYLNSINLEDFLTGMAQPKLNRAKLDIIPVPLPAHEEQEKIADCLSSVDELITAQTLKYDALKAHKKGLMQQLFPAEGETVPKLRFPEFRDAGEWKEQRIEDLAKRGSGHTPNKKNPGYYNGGIKWVSLADSKRLDNGYIYETTIEISKEGLNNSSAVLHSPGTVIISRDAGVGKSAILYSEMAVSQHFIAWLSDKSKLSNWFLYYYLQILKPGFERIAVGNTIKTIGLPYFKDLNITVPSLIEQQNIAACLSSIDNLITAQAQKIEALKTHKKGLMQQLFPSVDEVDG